MPSLNPERLRADSARVREQMLSVARERMRAGDADLPMNAIAKEAGVGVGTAYRHFPTHQVLLEALAADSLAALVADARTGANDPDPARGFARLMRAGLRLMLDDPALAAVLQRRDFACDETRELGAELFTSFGAVLDRARAGGAVRAGITADDLRRLMCGVQHAVRAGGDDGAAERYLDVMLKGLQNRAGSR
ncbi:TetR family transcriptional regulator [Paractinoplanes deccanensis]|uniref:TetR family transcriptional regulator n=1 Tax=Paractinoplanes deccanensis TaxID=113561 RepID=A0ABQ3YC65_9ACTN|nr:TetR family transcriptional regulator [Actinoplanes deccanensis]GID77616.1 TetR family transcriptional regulator [Actinoplanes deccanensis]